MVYPLLTAWLLGLKLLNKGFRYVFLTFFIDVAMQLILLILVYDMLKESGLKSVDSFLAFLFHLVKSYIIFIALTVQIISWLLRAHLITISKSFIEDSGRPDFKFIQFIVAALQFMLFTSLYCLQ